MKLLPAVWEDHLKTTEQRCSSATGATAWRTEPVAPQPACTIPNPPLEGSAGPAPQSGQAVMSDSGAKNVRPQALQVLTSLQRTCANI